MEDNYKLVRKIDSRTCVFCQLPADTRDHVPGKQFFPDPKPQDLQTVPCCSKCNKAHKKDEDYLRGLLCFGPAGVTLAGKSLWRQKLHRAYKKDLGLRKAIAMAMKRVTQVTPAGLILPPRLGIKIDWNRVYKVVEKWVRGLYYLEYDEALFPEVIVEIAPVHEGNRIIWSPIAPQLNPGKRGWSDIFLYLRNRVTEQPEVSCWLFHIYKSYELFALTGSPDKPPA